MWCICDGILLAEVELPTIPDIDLLPPPPPPELSEDLPPPPPPHMEDTYYTPNTYAIPPSMPAYMDNTYAALGSMEAMYAGNIYATLPRKKDASSVYGTPRTLRRPYSTAGRL